jgi:hypothetical protein
MKCIAAWTRATGGNPPYLNASQDEEGVRVIMRSADGVCVSVDISHEEWLEFVRECVTYEARQVKAKRDIEYPPDAA